MGLVGMAEAMPFPKLISCSIFSASFPAQAKSSPIRFRSTRTADSSPLKRVRNDKSCERWEQRKCRDPSTSRMEFALRIPFASLRMTILLGWIFRYSSIPLFYSVAQGQAIKLEAGPLPKSTSPLAFLTLAHPLKPSEGPFGFARDRLWCALATEAMRKVKETCREKLRLLNIQLD